MKLKIRGFVADIYKEGKYYVGTIRALHANTQAKTLKELKSNLNEVIDLVIEDVKRHQNEYPFSTIKKVKNNHSPVV